MKTFIALLRGINVGGHKKILMADLRNHLEQLNFKNVQTYIQSGNVVFQSSDKDVEALENAIKNQILKKYGFEVPVVVKSQQELKSIFDNCPFSEDKKKNSYFMIFLESPKEELIKEMSLIKYPNEEFYMTKNCIYFYCSLGYGRTKFNSNFFERKLKVSATARNYKTMVKLIEMIN